MLLLCAHRIMRLLAHSPGALRRLMLASKEARDELRGKIELLPPVNVLFVCGGVGGESTVELFCSMPTPWGPGGVFFKPPGGTMLNHRTLFGLCAVPARHSIGSGESTCCDALAICGLQQSTVLSSVHRFSLHTSGWSVEDFVPPMSAVKGVGAGYIHRAGIVVCGGLFPNQRGRSSEACLLSLNGTVSALPPLAVPRVYAAVAADDRCVYVCGGWNSGSSHESLVSCERFDCESMGWSPLPDMRTRRAGAGAAVLGPYLYVCSGVDSGNVITPTVERFDLRTGLWAFAAPMCQARTDFGLVAMDGKLWAIGGDTSGSKSYTNKVECYDPARDAWTVLDAQLAHARCYFSACVLQVPYAGLFRFCDS